MISKQKWKNSLLHTWRLWFTYFCALAFTFAAAPLYATETLLLSPETQTIELNNQHFKLFEDEEDSTTIEEIINSQDTLFSEIDREVINLGHSASSIWIHFKIKVAPAAEKQEKWMLEIGYPLLKRVDIYSVADHNIKERHQIGYSRFMFERAIPHRFFAQPLTFSPGKEYDLFINVMRKNGTIQVPLKLSRPKAFMLSELTSNYLFGIFFGIMIAMIAYNLILFLTIGSRAYLYYILYISSSALAYQTTTGFGFRLLWYEHPWLNEYMLQIPSCIAAITGLLFASHFMQVKKYYRFMNTTMTVMMLVGWLLIFIRVSTPYFLSEIITVYVGVISAVVPLIALMCWQKGSRSAGFFLIGWGMLLIGIVLFTLSLLGILPVNGITTNAVIVGCALETLLLSFGLADRINTERKEKFSALQEQHQTVVRLKEAEDQLMHQALHSKITGLPNRTLLRSSLDNFIQTNQEQPFSLILFNLNNVHEFNKTLGHNNGDTILEQITNRINDFCSDIRYIIPIEEGESDIHYLANVEGVTFALAIASDDQNHIQRVASHLIKELERHFEFKGLTLNMDASASVAFYPEHGPDSDNLIRNAHIALEAAYGSNEKLEFYSQSIDSYNSRRISQLAELRHAIANDGLDIYLQPQVNMHNHQIVGAEVLVRWNHPEYGLIPPSEFIPLAERTGVIQPLTYWVMKQAFGMKYRLAQQGWNINLSINISPRNLQDPHFKEKIIELSNKAGISLKGIILELTETSIMTDPEEALEVMKNLNKVGIRFSIDDFGTGYSSLSYLKRLPVNEIKIDRSFIMDIRNNSDDRLLVKTTATMGHNFGLEVVAEGIEDEETLKLAKTLGCNLAQGYHIARPMPSKEFINWINEYVNPDPLSMVHELEPVRK